MLEGINHIRARKALTQMECQDLRGVWVGGGFARAFFNNEIMKDVDVFFRDGGVRREWLKRMKALGAECIHEDKQYKLNGVYYDVSIDRFFEDADALIDFNDFTICAVVFTTDLRMHAHEDHVNHVINKELHVWKNFTVPTSLERAYRYIGYGYEPEDRNRFWAQVFREIRKSKNAVSA